MKRLGMALFLILLLSVNCLGAAHDFNTDVIVVGGGIGGVLYAAGTGFQKELGIEDHPDNMFTYWMNHSHWNLDPARF